MDRPGGRRLRTRLRRRAAAGRHDRSPVAHKSRVLGRDMVAGAHALSELPDEITTPGPRPDPRDGDQLRKPGGLRARRRETRRRARATGSVGGHRLRAAREPPARALAVARRALAGTRRPAGVHQQHARRAVRAVRGQGRRAAAGRASGVAHLHRPRDRHAQAAVRREGTQRLHQGHAAGSPGSPAGRVSSSGRTGSTGWWSRPGESSTAAGSNGAM